MLVDGVAQSGFEIVMQDDARTHQVTLQVRRPAV